MDLIKLIFKQNGLNFCSEEFKESFSTFDLNLILKDIPKTVLQEQLEKIIPLLGNMFFERNIFCTEAVVYFGRNNEDTIAEIDLINSENNDYLKISSEVIDCYECDELSIRFRFKKSTAQTIEIFSYETFCSYIASLKLDQSIEKWNSLISNGHIYFRVWNNIKSFGSSTISFTSYLNFQNIEYKTKLNRNQILKNRDKVCNFNSSSFCELLPLDFKINNADLEDKIQLHFNRLEKIFLISFIADRIKIENELLDIELIGYKTFSKEIKFKDIKANDNSELFDVYDWIYDSQQIVDKISIAKNILTLHMDDQLHIKEKNILSSIKSSFEIYLKENVQQYIDIKNKLSEFITKQSDLASESTKNIFKTFKSTSWSIVVFSCSSLFLKANNSNLTSPETLMTAISCFCAFSIILLILSLFEIGFDTYRIEEKFNTIEERYNYLLDKVDLDRLLNKKEELKKIYNFIIIKTSVYISVWIFITVSTYIVSASFLLKNWSLC